MTTTTTNHANIIWRQLSVQTKMACGMREQTSRKDGQMLRVKVLRSMRWIEITLDPSDTYTVELIRVKRGSHERVVVESVSDVYCDMLNDVVYHQCNK